MRAAVLLAMALFPVTLAAADLEFERAVHDIESQFQVRRTHVPLLGLAGFMTNFTGPFGVKHAQLAIFENVHVRGAGGFHFRELAPSWKPVVRVFNRNQEATVIYVRPEGNSWFEALLVTVDHDDATVIKAKVNPDSLMRWVNECRSFKH